jgi:inward rectifier potassium channel
VLRPEVASVRVGVPITPLTDLYYLLLQGSWTSVLGLFAALYLLANVVFAGLYLAGGDCINGARPGSFADAFFFSVQTIATIGYGAMTPKTAYANMLVTLESMIGMLGVAMATGITFAKFGRPRANVRFSRNVLIAPYDGRRSLYFRVANIRGNDVVEATISVSVLVSHTTAEGHTLRRVVDLPLTRARTPLFRLSWLVVHVIDEHSPLWGMALADIERERMMVVITLVGMDATFAQSVMARHVYVPDDVIFDHHFEDIVTELPDGRLEFDYGKFHHIRALTAAELRVGNREEIEVENSELLAAEAEDACVFQDQAQPEQDPRASTP